MPGADSQAYARQELGLEKVYGDFREMVTDPELDAVAIVSPSGEHCWQIEAALDAGKHVFSEKPLGVTMEQCLQAEAAVARHPELVPSSHLAVADHNLPLKKLMVVVFSVKACDSLICRCV